MRERAIRWFTALAIALVLGLAMTTGGGQPPVAYGEEPTATPTATPEDPNGNPGGGGGGGT